MSRWDCSAGFNTDPSIVQPYDLATGPDGNVWFTNYGGRSIGRITPTGAVSRFTAPAIDQPYGIAAGPDGNMWFTDVGSDAIGRITPAGTVATFTDASTFAPYRLTSGPDGNLWFTNYGGGTIGRITPAGAITHITHQSIHAPFDIATGADGNLWFTNATGASVGRVTTSGTVTNFASGITDLPSAMAAGPDGNLWFVAWEGNTVSRITSGAPSGASFHPVTPTRILDSRLPDNGFAGPVSSGTPRALQVTGRGGPADIPATATAVVMNVTVADSDSISFLSAYPSGAAPPTSSNLNFGPGQVIANLVTVKLGAGGRVDVANTVGSTHVIADVVGYYEEGAAGDGFNPVSPTRLLDSRTTTGGWNGRLAAGSPRALAVRQPENPTGVPATATAVVATVTVTNTTASSFLTVWPGGIERPNVSNVNFAAGETVPNLITVPIGADGSIRFANEIGEAHVVLDLIGYFDPTGGARFHPIVPTRVLDTRIGVGLSGAQGPGTTRGLRVGGRPGTSIPAWATGLVANVTVADATEASYVAVFPGDVVRPVPFSNLNFAPGQVVPNAVVVRVAPNGNIAFYNHLGTTALVADAAGYFARSA